MRFQKYLLSLAAVAALFTGCRDNNMPEKVQPESEINQNKVPLIEFKKPALVIIQGKESDYRLSNPKELEPFILRANKLSIEIAVIPIADLTFHLKGDKATLINNESLSAGQLIFFNGKELLITSAEDASTMVFDAFYKQQQGMSGASDLKTRKYRVSRNKADKFAYGERTINEDGNYTETSQAESVSATINSLPSKHMAELKNEVSSGDSLYPIIVRNPALQSYIWPYKGFELLFDNDLFSNTDRYYTNGVQLKYRSPAMAFWRINSILPVNMKKSMEYNSIELHHAMYTPFTTKVPPLLKDDRPYASTLYVRFSRSSDSPEQGISQRASFDIGVIGEAALGSYLQKGVHAGIPTNDEPLGWETQIGNDIIVNYNYELIRQFISSGPFSAWSIWNGSLGTLNTSAGTGIGIKVGNDNYLIAPLPGGFADLRKHSHNSWRYSFETAFTTRVVGYNATLTGGLLNKNNIYVLKPQEIERLLFIANAGIRMKYGRYGISIAQYYLSNEFKEGKSHFWGQIGIDIGF